MAVPPVGSTPPPMPPPKATKTPPPQQSANAQAATAAKPPAQSAPRNAPPATAPQATPAAPAAPAPTAGPTAPAPAATTGATQPPTTVEKALTDARQTRERVEAELAANKFDVRPPRREAQEAEQPGITYARATQLVARLQAYQIYQANAAELAGEVNPAQDELNQILQQVQPKPEG